MAVLQMNRIEICAMKRDRKGILELLQRRGTVELKDLRVEDSSLKKFDTSGSRAAFENAARTAAQAADVVERYSGTGKSPFAALQGRMALTPRQYAAFAERREDVQNAAESVVRLEREITERGAEAQRSETQMKALHPWLDLPVPQTFDKTKHTAVFIGSIEGEETAGTILAMLAAADAALKNIHVEIVSVSPEQTNFLAIVLKADSARAEDALRGIGFARPAATDGQLPKDKLQSLLEQRDIARDHIHACISKIETAKDSREDFLLLEDDMRMRADKYAAIAQLAHTNHVFVLEGYVPRKAAEPLCRELNGRFNCSALASPVSGDDEDVPVVLKNNRFAEPIEGVLSSYALPAAGDLDPTSVMSIFYFIMFGLMFSDAGYGVLLAGVTGFLLLRFKRMEHGTRMFMQMFFWCGISTIIWGVVFSSYFGDIVDVIAVNFLGRPADAPSLVPPLWFSPLENPMWLLMFCLAIGVVHLTTGYVMNGVSNFQKGDFAALFFDAALPVIFIYPLLIVLAGSGIFADMLGFRLYTLPESVAAACMAVTGASALGVLLFAGRGTKNWGLRFAQGLYALYNLAAGWLSDILSYSRLLALGLATGVIASVMNQLGTLAGGGVLGAILMLVVFLVGQALNFGINLLGAYVHSNRLEYVEFFGKFYEGGGRGFSPFGIHTKHYRLEEEQHV